MKTYKLRFLSNESRDTLNANLKHEKLKSFDDLVEEALEEILDEIYALAEQKGFYHADQINLKVSIDFQENEG